MRKEIALSGKSTTSAKNNRKYPMDETVFDTLNEKSLYWIGFLYGDGNCTCENKIRLQLGWNDRDHLFKFRDFIKSNDRPIKEITRVQHNVHSAGIEFRSWKVHNTIKKYGLTTTKDKRKRLYYELLEPKNRKDFIRGLFDADGSLYVDGHSGGIRTEITGYMPIMIDVKNILALDGIILETKNILRNGNIFRIRMAKEESIEFLKYLYGNKPFYYLKRKYDLANYHLERLNEET